MSTWFKIIGYVALAVGAVLLVLYVGFLDVWTVPVDDPMLSASIVPTLAPGDVVLVTRRTEVSRGNLLRCDDPSTPGRYVIARAISRFGDHLDITSEVVSIDGKRTPSARACDPPTMVVHDPMSNEDVTLACSIEEYGEMTYAALRSPDHPEPPTKASIEAGKWFLISDDRHVHLDSRDLGQIDPATCKHIVFRVQGAAGLGDAKSRFTIIW